MADDDLSDYEVDFGELDITIPDPPPLPTPAPPLTAGKKRKDDLGLDDEVEIKKKRVVVKLDEQRLLSINGLPKLHKEAPQKLTFKGKGHEYKDAARLLSYYQLWADDLFRKARFRDTLQIIEKLGHSRAVRAAREDWINERRRGEKGVEEYAEGEQQSKILTGAADDDSNDDDLYSVPAPPQNPPAVVSDPSALFLGGPPDSDDEMGEFDDADIEAAMREAEEQRAAETARKATTLPVAPVAPKAPAAAIDEFDEFDDADMEAAMREVEEQRKAETARKATLPVPTTDRDGFGEFDDEMEELEALEAMGAFGPAPQPSSKPPAPRPPAKVVQEVADDFEDDWDAME